MNQAAIASVAVFAVLMGACVIETGAGLAGGVAVSGPPPDPMQEVRPEQRPPPLRSRPVWIPGYWHWTGMQYTWIPGHWAEAPAGTPDARWRPPRYLLRDGVYYYEPGGWVVVAPPR